MRSLASFREYYDRWSLVWEAQALLRATPVAGDPGLGERFLELIAPLRWPEGGLDDGQLREIRTLKARMESERLPRGADRKTHFKLGHGGLSDVEWAVQLVQLRHAFEHPGLRTTSTMGALDEAERLGLVSPEHAADLSASWRLASSMRNAGVLFRARALDAVPTDPRDADGIARILGLPGRFRPGPGRALPAHRPPRTGRARGRVLRRLTPRRRGLRAAVSPGDERSSRMKPPGTSTRRRPSRTSPRAAATATSWSTNVGSVHS